MRHFLFLALCLCAALSSTPATARDVSKYKDPSIKDLTEMSAQLNLINMESLTQFNDYLRLTECSKFLTIKDSPFEQEKARQEYAVTLRQTPQLVKDMHYRIATIFFIEKYDFDTQSFTINNDAAFKRVNTLEIFNLSMTDCNNPIVGYAETLPGRYLLRLNYPISLYRIPMQKTIAQTIFEKLDISNNLSNSRMIYGYLYVRVENLKPEINHDAMPSYATLRGQIDGIELFMDHDRRTPIKYLDYSEIY